MDESRLRRVSSRQNALVKDLRKALSQGEPTAEGYLAIEGVRMIEEAIRSGLRFQAVFFSEAGSAHATRLLPQIGSQVEILLLPDEVFVSAVSTESPQGVPLLVKLRPHKFEDLLESEPIPCSSALPAFRIREIWARSFARRKPSARAPFCWEKRQSATSIPRPCAAPPDRYFANRSSG